jgi:hypothetical protein
VALRAIAVNIFFFSLLGMVTSRSVFLLLLCGQLLEHSLIVGVPLVAKLDAVQDKDTSAAQAPQDSASSFAHDNDAA